MAYRLQADMLVFVHIAFILFVLFGGFIALWHRRAACLHLSSAAWGVLVESVIPHPPIPNWHIG